MAFDYPVTLDLEGELCLVAGSGPLAVERLTGLLRSRADVVVLTPDPSPALVAQCAAFNRTIIPRLPVPADMQDATLVIVTREDEVDVAALHAAAREHGTLFAALDDVAHCDFGAVSQIHRGPLTVTISSSGKAPALAKRLRKRLERELEPELSDLVGAIDRAKATHGPRDVPFDVWAARWEHALADLDGLLASLRDGDATSVEAHILAALRTEAPASGNGRAATSTSPTDRQQES